MIGFCSFFIITELEALWFDPVEYVSEWGTNLTDLLPLVLVYVNTIRSLSESGPVFKSFWVIQSLASITLWLKFVYFLRSMPYFAYLVRTLRETFNYIAAFFIILIITCLGFADAFLSLSRSMKDEGFLDNYYAAFRYSWLFVLGGSDPVENDIYGDILYFLASIFLIIIMLNVLIATAGEALSAAQESKTEYAFKAKVELLRDLQSHPILRIVEWVKEVM